MRASRSSLARHCVATPPRRIRAGVAVSLATTAIVVVALGPGGPASAAGPVSQGQGTFLGGTALGINLDTLLAVAPATAVNNGATPTVSDIHPLDVTALNAVNVNLGSGINLLGTNGLLVLGAVNQMAAANDDGSSTAASGAVTDTGAVAIGGGGPQGDASLDLQPLLSGAGVSGAVSALTLSVGALAATATQAAPGSSPPPTGTYQIAGLNLGLTSPLLSGLYNQVVGAVGTASTALSVLCVLPLCTMPNLAALLTPLTSITAAGGAIAVDLQTGTVTIDLNAFLAFHGLNINALAPNTDLLALINADLSGDLTGAITTEVTSLLTNVTTAIGALGLGALVNALVGALTTSLQGLIAGVQPTVITPVLSAVDTVVAVTLNGQTPTPPAAGAAFTETALSIALIPAAPLARVDLASATVGLNAGPLAAPTATGLTPAHGPAVGGTSVTVTGTGFVPGATSVTIGGNVVAAADVVVAVDGASLTFVTPAHVPGAVGVTVTTPGGTSAPLAYAYDPVPAPVITAPADGSSVAIATPPISGTGVDGDTVTVSEAGVVLCGAVVSGGVWSCTPSTSLVPGDHTITAIQTDSAGNDSAVSAPVTFDVAAAAATSAPPSSAATPPSSELPTTGSDVRRPLGWAVALLVLGCGLVALGRRRRAERRRV